jgi:hypothetical protein
MSVRNAIDREALRGLIRQMLRDAVPADVQKKLAAALKTKGAAPKTAKTLASAALQENRTEDVSIATDGDLQRFAQRLLALAEDAASREAIKSGKLKFRLAGRGPVSATAPKRQPREERSLSAPQPSGNGHRIDKGLVAERHIVAAAKNGKKLTVAKGVAVTPLARDKARQLGVVIERE